MAYTDNLSLEKVAAGQSDWETAQNANMEIIDGLIGEIDFTDGSSGSLEAKMLVYFSAADTVQEADADDATKPAAGVCVSTNGTTAKLRFAGHVSAVKTVGAADISAGDILYLSTTAGKVTKTAPASGGNLVQVVGRATSDESSSTVDMLIIQDPTPDTV